MKGLSLVTWYMEVTGTPRKSPYSFQLPLLTLLLLKTPSSVPTYTSPVVYSIIALYVGMEVLGRGMGLIE